MRARERAAMAVLSTLSALPAVACRTEAPTFDWFDGMAALHVAAAPDAAHQPIHGFDELTEEHAPRTGDQVLYSVQLDTPSGTDRWLMHVVVEKAANDKDLVELGVSVRKLDGTEVARVSDTIHERHLSGGLFPGAEVLSRHRVEQDERPTVIASLHAMLAFVSVMRRNEQLADLLWKVVEKPSLLSIVLHLGIDTDIDLDWPEAFSASPPLPYPDVRAYRVPLAMSLNDNPALDCSIVVVEPRAPLSAGAGIVSLVAERPDGSGTHLVMRLLAARRGPR